MKLKVWMLLWVLGMSLIAARCPAAPQWTIEKQGDIITIRAGELERVIRLDGVQFATTSLQVAAHEILTEASPELAFTLAHAQPNRAPQRISVRDESQAIESTATFRATDALSINEPLATFDSGVEWVEPLNLDSRTWSEQFDRTVAIISSPRDGVTRLTLRSRAMETKPLQDVSVAMVYEIYQGHSAIRQWVEVVNNSPVWYRLDRLMLAPMPVGKSLKRIQPLTPDDKAVAASIRGFASDDQSYGLILGSEAPSATRVLDVASGVMGYAEPYFEWVLGPAERFVSEPVSYYGFAGAVTKTVSAVSTPLDRCIEGEYRTFLSDCLGVMADRANLRAPRYCTWSNYAENIDEKTARQIIPLAAQCGFDTFQFDDGWQSDRLGTEPHPEKFPTFDAMCDLVAQQNMTLGLWVSCYRSADSKDLRVLPEAASMPPVKRLTGYGMGFASDWRNYYAQDLVYLNDRYGAKYFKQDFTNIRLGDLAASHESRTRKESYLRALRGLLDSQSLVRELSPDITTLISHEIYWGTPGVPCDLAVMKQVCFYHIPPNDYAGLGPVQYRKQLVSQYESKAQTDPVRRDLLAGCWHARQRYYAHRGLPLNMLEYYGAATANVQNALTADIQDRQLCSFLMGAPVVYAGDLLSLTPENIQHYRQRFDLLKELQQKYNIYRNFQFSGAPAPTEEDWHWWGKLNANREGAVVVLRGTGGDAQRAINIPWVDPGQRYTVSRLLNPQDLGAFTGLQLQQGAINLALPNLGQEILRIQRVAVSN